MAFYGMDTAQVTAHAELLQTRHRDIGQRVETLQGLVAGLDGMWRGPDADAFAASWETVRSQADATLEQKFTLCGQLFEHVEAQDVTSAADAAAALGEMVSQVFRGGDVDLRSFFPNPNDWEDWVGMGASALFDGLGGALTGITTWANLPKTLATAFIAGGDDMLNAVKGMGAAASKAGKILGPVGAVATGAFAGWDRWDTDSQDPSLSTGEKVFRAGADGIANAGGGALGAWGGAAGGAAIGTMICPGVGTVIGGAIGGIAGGLAGSSLGNGLIDWALG